MTNVSRHSLFVGGGAGIGNSPITGGSGGPFRLGVDLSLADSIFEPLARCQLVKANEAKAQSVFNDTLMKTGMAFYELQRREAAVQMAQENLADAQRLVATTSAFVEAGKGADADNMRSKVIEQSRRQVLLEANGQRSSAAARLARLLQLDPTKVDPGCGLTVLNKEPVPIDLVARGIELNSLIGQAYNFRPEINQYAAQLGFAEQKLALEAWRPALPNVFVGGSAGGFGGGPGSDFPNFDGRGDLDVAVAWQLKNLGMGAKSTQSERLSQRQQAEYQLAGIRDQIAAEVSEAYFETEARREQVELAQQNIVDGQQSLNANVERIRELEGMPLELIQALESLASARENYLNTVIDFNLSQLKLLRAVGMTADVSANN